MGNVMYRYIMHRTQILLEDEQYELLKSEAARTGRSIGDLVRAAVGEVYRDRRRERLQRALRDSYGAAEADDFDGLDGEAYVEQIRHEWSRRRAELGWDS
jgi:hypothetical protein